MFNASESACARSTSVSPTRTCRRLSNLSMVPLSAERRRVLPGRSSGLPRGAGHPPQGSVSRAHARVPPVARHPGGATLHRSGSAMGAAPGADRRYLVRCAHKIGCLLRGNEIGDKRSRR